MLIAVENRNSEIVTALVNRKVKVDVSDASGKDVLIIAIDNSDTDSIAALLKGGANPNALYEGEPIILKAINEENYSLLQLLIDSKVKVNIKNQEGIPLLYAATLENNTKLVEELIRGGARGHFHDKENRYPMDIALEKKNYEICLSLFDCPDSNKIKINEGRKYLIETVKNSDSKSLEKLLGYGMNPNEKDNDGNTLLMLALINEDLETIRILVANGAEGRLSNNKGETVKNYLVGTNFNIKYEIGKAIYHYTDEGVKTSIIILFSLITLYIIYLILSQIKAKNKWELLTCERNEFNETHSKSKNKEEKEPRKIFRIIHLFNKVLELDIPEKEKQILHTFFIFILQSIDPFFFVNEIYRNLFNKNYIVCVNNEFNIKEIRLDKENLKALKKFKKINLRYSILNYIFLLHSYLNIKITPRNYGTMLEYLSFAKQKNKKKVLKIMSRIENYRMMDSDTKTFDLEQNEYMVKQLFNIAVCATMSAGKSTFVNALLGNDCLPARNEATTAIITSVYDFDGMNNISGYCTNEKNLPVDISIDANLNQIDEWNNNSDGKHNRIFLQSDFDGISFANKITLIHDTPGTNNSSDDNHHKITFDFLQSHKMDAIIFVANGEHLCSTDENALLKELNEKVFKKLNIPVIFILNKVDSIDEEKESLSNAVVKYKEYLSEIGMKDPIVFPVSSKAARLLKMALKNKSDLFTESECDAFPSIVKKFTKRLNLSDVGEIASEAEEKILIDGESYEKSDLITALFHTGIHRIENEIEQIVK